MVNHAHAAGSGIRKGKLMRFIVLTVGLVLLLTSCKTGADLVLPSTEGTATMPVEPRQQLDCDLIFPAPGTI